MSFIAMLQEPATYQTIAGICSVIALILGYFKHRELYKKAWGWIIDAYDVLHHSAIVLIALTGTFLSVALFIYIKQPEIIEKVSTSFPSFYTYGIEYGPKVCFVFLVIVTIIMWFKYADHLIAKKRQDTRPKRNSTIEDALVMRIEELERLRQLDSQAKDSAIDELKDMVFKSQRRLYDLGERFEKDPTPPERRKVVRPDPSVPLTEEELLEILPGLKTYDVLEETLPDPEVILNEEAINQVSTEIDLIREEMSDLGKKPEEKVIVSEYGRIDQFFWKIRKMDLA